MLNQSMHRSERAVVTDEGISLSFSFTLPPWCLKSPMQLNPDMDLASSLTHSAKKTSFLYINIDELG